ncbi:hypothetical protein BSL82_04945 [Tardibacter chloracetimidivorans]|uniref:Uncharacterized protein n=1 Tax=Tardibacter chloracetimidivorans TaxID=1921510 RepID=A0A1L3ZSX7_9SPHN|nr:hypothetical protein BSL82_04945 [Tardibacter chloracetimidivorans]
MAKIDAMRGSASRSEAIRRLVEAGLGER